MADNPSSILIVGASRGLGAGLAREFGARGWSVVATTRSPGGNGTAAPGIRFEQVDIDEKDQVRALHDRLAETRFDVVFVVAGVTNADKQNPIHEVAEDEAMRLFRTNALSPIAFAEAFADLVAPGGTIALMSSTLGSVARNDSGGWDAYRASKAALNTLGRSFAARHRGKAGFGVLLVHPGWVRTDMGGQGADLEVGESVAGMADMIEARRGARDCAFVDWQNRVVPW